jgi:hypothetical protein
MLIFLLIACTAVAIGLGGFAYFIVREINPPPEHLQDLDRLPLQLSDFESAPVDHVYLYHELCLHGSTYLRYHFVNTGDFEAKRQRINTGLQQNVQRQRSNVDSSKIPILREPSDSPEDADVTWWDWRKQVDREVCGLTSDTVYVFDKARKIVYVYFCDE